MSNQTAAILSALRAGAMLRDRLDAEQVARAVERIRERLQQTDDDEAIIGDIEAFVREYNTRPHGFPQLLKACDKEAVSEMKEQPTGGDFFNAYTEPGVIYGFALALCVAEGVR